jgi:hypothetical protein
MKNNLFISCLALMVFFASCEDIVNSEDPTIIYPVSKFVAIASGSGWTAWSEDGKTWTHGGDLPAKVNDSGIRDPVYWNGIAYGRGKFAAITTNQTKAASSTDGITWTETELSSSLPFPNIVYGNGTFVAVSSAVGSHNAVYSTNGKEWESSSGPSGGSSVAYGDGKFLAITSGGSVAISEDGGSTWTTQSASLSGSGWCSVVYGNGKFVALSNSGHIACSYIDRDGTLLWEEKTGAVPAFSSKAIYGGHRFVAVFGGVLNSSNEAAWSEDGETWTQATLPSSARWNSISYGDGVFVALAPGAAAWSKDGGETWAKAEGLPGLEAGASWVALAFMEGY